MAGLQAYQRPSVAALQNNPFTYTSLPGVSEPPEVRPRAGGFAYRADTGYQPLPSTYNANVGYNPAQAQNDLQSLQRSRAGTQLQDLVQRASTAAFSTAPSTAIAAGPREQLQRVGGAGNADAAQAAAFGAAKAKAGAMGRASLDALRAELADRGVLGGGIEARDVVQRLAEATNPLSDLNIAQQQESLALGEKAKDRQMAENAAAYTGAIAQRGQDIQAQQAAASRNQQMLEGLMRAFSSRLY